MLRSVGIAAIIAVNCAAKCDVGYTECPVRCSLCADFARFKILTADFVSRTAATLTPTASATTTAAATSLASSEAMIAAAATTT